MASAKKSGSCINLSKKVNNITIKKHSTRATKVSHRDALKSSAPCTLVLGRVRKITPNGFVFNSMYDITHKCIHLKTYFCLISDIANSYVASLHEQVASNDFILAQVINREKELVSLKAPHCGVIFSFCCNCKKVIDTPITLCKNCAHSIFKKYSIKYCKYARAIINMYSL